MPQFVTCKTFTNSISTKLQQFKHSICPFFCYSTSHSNAFLGEKPLFHHQYSHTWNTINFHILFIDVSVNTQFGFKEGGLRPCHSVHYDNLQSPACQWEMPRLRQTLSYITDSLRTLWPFFRFPLCIQHRIIKKKCSPQNTFLAFVLSGSGSPVAPGNLFLICRPNSDKPWLDTTKHHSGFDSKDRNKQPKTRVIVDV